MNRFKEILPPHIKEDKSYPELIALGIMLLSILIIDIIGYYHGNMTLLETLKNLWLNKGNYKIFMLSTQYRLRLQAICKDIAAGTEVTLEDMIWAEKLSRVNTSARGMLSQARRLSTDEDGSCLKFLDIGDPKTDKKGFSGADDIAEWFRNDKSDDWRQRDWNILHYIISNTNSVYSN